MNDHVTSNIIDDALQRTYIIFISYMNILSTPNLYTELLNIAFGYNLYSNEHQTFLIVPSMFSLIGVQVFELTNTRKPSNHWN